MSECIQCKHAQVSFKGSYLYEDSSIIATLIKEDEKSFIFAVFPRMHIEYDQFQVQHYSVIGNLYSAAQSVLREFDFMNHHYDMVYHHEKNTPYKHFQIIVYVQKEVSSSVDTSM